VLSVHFVAILSFYEFILSYPFRLGSIVKKSLRFLNQNDAL